MASKQSIAKEVQGYDQNPIQPECRNCKHFASEFEKQEYGPYEVETNLRCGLGGFAVKKLATCSKHEFKTKE